MTSIPLEDSSPLLRPISTSNFFTLGNVIFLSFRYDSLNKWTEIHPLMDKMKGNGTAEQSRLYETKRLFT